MKRLMLISIMSVGLSEGVLPQASDILSEVARSGMVCGGAVLLAAVAGGTALSAQLWQTKSGKKTENDITRVVKELQQVRYAIKYGALIEYELREYQAKEVELEAQLKMLVQRRPLIIRWCGGKKSGVAQKIAGGLWAAFAVCGVAAAGTGVWCWRKWKRAVERRSTSPASSEQSGNNSPVPLPVASTMNPIYQRSDLR